MLIWPEWSSRPSVECDQGEKGILPDLVTPVRGRTKWSRWGKVTRGEIHTDTLSSMEGGEVSNDRPSGSEDRAGRELLASLHQVLLVTLNIFRLSVACSKRFCHVANSLHHLADNAEEVAHAGNGREGLRREPRRGRFPLIKAANPLCSSEFSTRTTLWILLATGMAQGSPSSYHGLFAWSTSSPQAWDRT